MTENPERETGLEPATLSLEGSTQPDAQDAHVAENRLTKASEIAAGYLRGDSSDTREQAPVTEALPQDTEDWLLEVERLQDRIDEAGVLLTDWLKIVEDWAKGNKPELYANTLAWLARR